MTADVFLLRRRWYGAGGRQRQLRQPVISVGNISMGGRGKTPVVAHLAQLLLDAGERPAILTRGYRRRRPEPGVVVVSDGRHLLADLDRSGDEPLMLARAVPGAAVLVCDERAIAGALAERALGATVHLLDDGFQHLRLARDIDLVIVAPEDLAGRPAPFGKLRETVAVLADADTVIMDGPPDLNAVAEAVASRPTFSLSRSVGAPIALEPARGVPDMGSPIVAMAGIARPERFTRGLRAAGWSVGHTAIFRDHHPYTRRDLEHIADLVRDVGAQGVLTTAKDAARLGPLRPLPVAVSYVPLTVDISPASEFRAWLLDRLDIARAAGLATASA